MITITTEQKAVIALLGFFGGYDTDTRDDRDDGPLVALALGALDATSEWPRGPLYLFSFGANGNTHVVARGNGIKDALEHAAAVLPAGIFTDPDYAGNDSGELAEAGLTYTEYGWLASHEWTVRDLDA